MNSFYFTLNFILSLMLIFEIMERIVDIFIYELIFKYKRDIRKLLLLTRADGPDGVEITGLDLSEPTSEVGGEVDTAQPV